LFKKARKDNPPPPHAANDDSWSLRENKPSSWSHHEQALATDLSNFQTAEAWLEERWRAPIEQQQEMPIIIDIVVMVEERCKTRSQQMQRHARK
jgi:hypothetical protein